MATVAKRTKAAKATQTAPETTPAGWTKHDPHEMLKALQSMHMEVAELAAMASHVSERAEEIETKMNGLLNIAELADPLVQEAMNLAHGDDGLMWTAIDVCQNGRMEVTPRCYNTRNALREWATVEACEAHDRSVVTIFWPSTVPLPEWATEREPAIVV